MAVEKDGVLANITENTAEHAELWASSSCHDVTFGPVRIKFCVNISIPEVTFEVYLHGTLVASGTLSKTHPTITIQKKIGPASIKLTLTLDPAKKCITFDLTACLFGACFSRKGNLFCW
jgi:hypothetical protein